jgi:hypothetical protein
VMLVLRTTRQTQGQRDDDFCWTNDEELAFFGVPCARDDCNDTDGRGPCGCRRSFCGLDTLRGSTTAVVVASSLTLDDLVRLFTEHYEVVWNRTSQEARTEAQAMAQHIIKLCARFGRGTVLEKRGPSIHPRQRETMGERDNGRETTRV